jgi:hypothetical protein
MPGQPRKFANIYPVNVKIRLDITLTASLMSYLAAQTYHVIDESSLFVTICCFGCLVAGESLLLFKKAVPHSPFASQLEWVPAVLYFLLDLVLCMTIHTYLPTHCPICNGPIDGSATTLKLVVAITEAMESAQ